MESDPELSSSDEEDTFGLLKLVKNDLRYFDTTPSIQYCRKPIATPVDFMKPEWMDLFPGAVRSASPYHQVCPSPNPGWMRIEWTHTEDDCGIRVIEAITNAVKALQVICPYDPDCEQNCRAGEGPHPFVQPVGPLLIDPQWVLKEQVGVGAELPRYTRNPVLTQSSIRELRDGGLLVFVQMNPQDFLYCECPARVPRWVRPYMSPPTRMAPPPPPPPSPVFLVPAPPSRRGRRKKATPMHLPTASTSREAAALPQVQPWQPQPQPSTSRSLGAIPKVRTSAPAKKSRRGRKRAGPQYVEIMLPLNVGDDAEEEEEADETIPPKFDDPSLFPIPSFREQTPNTPETNELFAKIGEEFETIPWPEQGKCSCCPRRCVLMEFLTPHSEVRDTKDEAYYRAKAAGWFDEVKD